MRMARLFRIRIFLRVALAFELAAAFVYRYMRINAGVVNIFVAAAHDILAVIRTITGNVARRIRVARTFQNIPFVRTRFAVFGRILIFIKTAAAGTIFLADEADFGRNRCCRKRA